MAALARLRARLPALREEYFRRNRCVDEDRKIKYKAAVKIQSWFRGCRVRAYLRHLNKMVICIQKRWRGYQSRRYFRKIVKTAYFIMKMNFYNEMAVRIQKRWRGYYVRKYIHNYYALKKYLEAVSVNNEIVRNELQEYAEMNENERRKKDQEKKEKEKKYQARKMHYLLSTEQGPFRDTAEVLRQRYKPLEPTLRVATSIDSPLGKARAEMKREEWRNHIHDNEFLPFSSYHKNEKYDPSIHRSGKYGQETYGIKHFREVQPNKWVTGKDFQTVSPSIVLFEKFGKTYSRCGQIV
ncbi:spermatogenesis-associated protein 17 isoform X3 [Anas acuta]|uniref:spermatogenesis-associated protein 17 isoform X3 n=1 Tax=Anas platyrhynchos TaxID=8839 RepID=UPI0018D88F72|nr:spermatogenesis-associated protein 17 isoform X3 [Anas platyrhynchos]